MQYHINKNIWLLIDFTDAVVYELYASMLTVSTFCLPMKLLVPKVD